MKWQDKLTKKELAHLRNQALCTSLAMFKRTRDIQIMARDEAIKAGQLAGTAEPCWECRNIAKKLGIE